MLTWNTQKQHFFHARTVFCFSSHMANIWVTPSIPFSCPPQPLSLFSSKWMCFQSLSTALFPQQVAYQTVCVHWTVSLTPCPTLWKPKPPITVFLWHLCEAVVFFPDFPVVPMRTPSADLCRPQLYYSYQWGASLLTHTHALILSHTHHTHMHTIGGMHYKNAS